MNRQIFWLLDLVQHLWLHLVPFSSHNTCLPEVAGTRTTLFHLMGIQLSSYFLHHRPFWISNFRVRSKKKKQNKILSTKGPQQTLKKTRKAHIYFYLTRSTTSPCCAHHGASSARGPLAWAAAWFPGWHQGHWVGGASQVHCIQLVRTRRGRRCSPAACAPCWGSTAAADLRTPAPRRTGRPAATAAGPRRCHYPSRPGPRPVAPRGRLEPWGTRGGSQHRED